MNVHHLSKRLETVADYLPPHSHFVDIGSDHAYLPCYVCLNDPLAKAIAGEVNIGPYKSALAEVKAHDLSERIDVRHGDGLDILHKGEVKQLVIAGMGGPLIKDILEKGRGKLDSVNRIITQPNIDARSIRRWFNNNDYQLVDETILEENGHIYEVLVADRGIPGTPYVLDRLEKEMWLGPYLLNKGGRVFQRKCQEELEKKQHVLHQVQQASIINGEKLAQLQLEIQWLKEVLEK